MLGRPDAVRLLHKWILHLKAQECLCTAQVGILIKARKTHAPRQQNQADKAQTRHTQQVAGPEQGQNVLKTNDSTEHLNLLLHVPGQQLIVVNPPHLKEREVIVNIYARQAHQHPTRQAQHRCQRPAQP